MEVYFAYRIDGTEEGVEIIIIRNIKKILSENKNNFYIFEPSNQTSIEEKLKVLDNCDKLICLLDSSDQSFLSEFHHVIDSNNSPNSLLSPTLLISEGSNSLMCQLSNPVIRYTDWQNLYTKLRNLEI